jgi:hypothetical protein
VLLVCHLSLDAFRHCLACCTPVHHFEAVCIFFLKGAVKSLRFCNDPSVFPLVVIRRTLRLCFCPTILALKACSGVFVSRHHLSEAASPLQEGEIRCSVLLVTNLPCGHRVGTSPASIVSKLRLHLSHAQAPADNTFCDQVPFLV